MIGGLLQNSATNTVEKAPWLGDIPILGALFRSNGFRRNETELIIVITPYLVKPVSAGEIALPTDGYRSSNDAQRVLLDQRHHSLSGEQRPVPTIAPAQTHGPGIDAVGATAIPAQPSAVQQAQTRPAGPSAAPGFSF
jgi:pilus assembly protein CpaC